ncbi:MAG: hypothetical protein K2J90_13535 [Lachnospiraceae bacterium]|nr:hypothetical protein [Lachnospiraceae bacterium]
MYKGNKELRKYFKETKKQTYMYNGSSRFLNELKDSVYSYIAENPNISINDIHEKYGTPSELAKEFFQEVDMETYKRKTLTASFVRRIFIICLILFISLLLCLFINRQMNRPTTVKYYIETPS